jgi:hypothetical protein
MMAQDIGNADILETTISGRRVDKYSVLAEAAYIETVDQNVAVLPRGRSLNPNAASLIVLTTAPHYSEITNPNLTTVADDDSRTIAGINRRGLSRVGTDFDRRFAGCHANWTAVYFAGLELRWFGPPTDRLRARSCHNNHQLPRRGAYRSEQLFFSDLGDRC